MLEHHAYGTSTDANTTLEPDAGPVTLLYRANHADEVILAHELDALARAEHIEVHYVLGAPGSDNDVLVDHRLRHLVPDLEDRDAFVCGPPRFMEAARDSLLRCGVPARHIHTEQFTF